MTTDEQMLKHNPDKPINQGWSLDRKINIYGTLGMVLAMASWIWTLSDRVADNKREIASHKELMNVQLQNLKDDRIHAEQISTERFTEIRVQLIRIEDKVDRHSGSNHEDG